MSGELRAAPDERPGMLRGSGLKLSDRELTRRLRAADVDAAEALVNTYGARAHRLAVRNHRHRGGRGRGRTGRIMDCGAESRDVQG